MLPAKMNFSDDLTDVTDDGTLDDLYALMRQNDVPDLYILTAVLSLLFVIGTVGNIIVICVFSRSFIKHTSTYFILFLAIVDLVICIAVLPGVLVKNWSYPFKLDAVCKMWEFIRMATVPVSALTLMAIGFDRFYLICMASEGPLSTSVAKTTIVAITAIGIILGLPPTLGVGVYQKGDNPGKVQYLGLCMPNTILITEESLQGYWKAIVTIICTVFIVMTITYSFIFIKVFKQNRKWNSVKKNKVHPVQEDIQKGSQNHIIRRNWWTRLRHIAGIIPAQNETGNIFVVRVRSHQVQPPQELPSNVSNPDSDGPGQGDSGLGSTENCRVSRSTSSNETNKLQGSSDNVPNRQLTYGRQRTAHIKTAKVLMIVSVVYFISYCPPLLISADLIPDLLPNLHYLLFYSYFLHSAANPIIYSFMNKKFPGRSKETHSVQVQKKAMVINTVPA
ncbi:neuropeptide F receptor-like [Haliotis rubra]|uniref:neuropeptide F receptor-like n=1 Tax=Haliotis rubra TaxID=36100 RepID=UPI001EE55891|nr:neuropeptide F receptor-like [Haliotis rubra]XP_046543292.1 neuropeptide F receptor-like [Haliotis rubra]